MFLNNFIKFPTCTPLHKSLSGLKCGQIKYTFVVKFNYKQKYIFVFNIYFRFHLVLYVPNISY